MDQQHQVDAYVWGSERILWGNSLSHKYTYKLLMPKVGRDGCLSLQSHKDKSETWLVVKGKVWSLTIKDWKIQTKILNEGDSLSIEAGTIHRLMGLTEGCIVAEASTPDRHAADKSITKDVTRWHCVFGRECSMPPSGEYEKELILAAIKLTEEAIAQAPAPKEDSYQVLYF